jgi:hypothetical protein
LLSTHHLHHRSLFRRFIISCRCKPPHPCAMPFVPETTHGERKPVASSSPPTCRSDSLSACLSPGLMTPHAGDAGVGVSKLRKASRLYGHACARGVERGLGHACTRASAKSSRFRYAGSRGVTDLGVQRALAGDVPRREDADKLAVALHDRAAGPGATRAHRVSTCAGTLQDTVHCRTWRPSLSHIVPSHISTRRPPATASVERERGRCFLTCAGKLGLN